MNPTNRRILLIDDNASIHADFKKILCPNQGKDTALADAMVELFGDTEPQNEVVTFAVDSAMQGEEGLKMVQQAVEEGRPYAMAFVDVRMPPGWDGIETTEKIWQTYPDLQVVICTAYSDYSWDDMIQKVGQSDRLVILKKPFDNVEALQLAHALTAKWQLLQVTRSHVTELEERVLERTQALQCTNASLQSEITERRRAETWLAAEKEILECLASNAPLQDTLDVLTHKIEALGDGLICSILQLDADGIHLRPGSAPSLPAAFNEALDGVEIGPEVGSCGTAAFLKKLVVVADIATDPLWKNYRDLALGHGLRACWSAPVLSPKGDTLGTFAIYHREIAEPTSTQLELIRRATSLLSLTLNREREEAARLRMEQQLSHAQKLESIGQLAAGIAHEINTPTQYIGDNTRFLQDAFADLHKLLGNYDKLYVAAEAGAVSPELLASVKTTAATADVAYLGEEIPKAIEQSLQGVQRVSKIVSSMKEFSHPGTSEKTAIDLNRAIESTLTVATNEWKYIANMVTDFDATLPPVHCLPGEFNQVILNMVVNASHAIVDVVGDGSKGKGTITISTKRDGDWVEVRIGDSGTGIPEAIRRKIFDPFFTTKGVGKGTGQGLAIAHSVAVDKHGGFIDVESEVGRGTTFIIRLPINPLPEKKAA